MMMIKIFPSDLEKNMVTKTIAAPKKRGRPAKKTVDWEKLAKQLQAALEKEMDESELLELRYRELEEKADLITENLFKAQGVIEYLEEKRGHNPV